MQPREIVLIIRVGLERRKMEAVDAQHVQNIKHPIAELLLVKLELIVVGEFLSQKRVNVE
jgi:uncharacterized membrane protein affecting hemolysin expression